MSTKKTPTAPHSKSVKAAGDLDPSFGTDGLVTIPNPDEPDAFFYISGITNNPTADADNRLYVCYWFNETYIMRLLQDGQIDTSFGNAGYTKLPKGNPATDYMPKMHDFIFLTSGKIIGWGDIRTFDRENDMRFTIPAAVCFTSEGVVDTTFGDAGIAIFRLFVSPESVRSLETLTEESERVRRPSKDANKTERTLPANRSRAIRLENGKLLLVGTTYYEGDLIIASYLIRLNADGALDTDFGENGIVVLPAPDDWMLSVYFDTDRRGGVFVASNFGYDNLPATIVGYDTEGQVDPRFGINGLVPITNPVEPALGSRVWGIIVLDDGRVIVSVTFVTWDSGTYPTALMILLPNGNPDPEFNYGEPVFIKLTQGGSFVGSTISMDDGNRIVLSGTREKPNEPSLGCMVRLMPNGMLDTGFGSGGTAVFEHLEEVDITVIQNRVDIIMATPDPVSGEGVLFRVTG